MATVSVTLNTAPTNAKNTHADDSSILHGASIAPTPPMKSNAPMLIALLMYSARLARALIYHRCHFALCWLYVLDALDAPHH